eukprot:13254197-Ditylum_brightwellii.AAC.1
MQCHTNNNNNQQQNNGGAIPFQTMTPTAQQGGMNNNMPIFQMSQPPVGPHTYNPYMMRAQFQQFLQMMGAQYQQFPHMMGTPQQNSPGQNCVTQQQQGHGGIPSAKWYNNQSYSWMHGYDIANNHTSQSCRQSVPGH